MQSDVLIESAKRRLRLHLERLGYSGHELENELKRLANETLISPEAKPSMLRYS